MTAALLIAAFFPVIVLIWVVAIAVLFFIWHEWRW